MTDIETLTSAELKARLYHSLKEKGLVDQLKVIISKLWRFIKCK